MNIQVHEQGNSRVACVLDEEVILTDTASALQLIADLSYTHNCTKILLQINQVAPEFFDLKTGLAGEILQKYTNYGTKLAIVGDFSQFTSKSLRDFILESNKGSRFFFLPDENAALNALHQSV